MNILDTALCDVVLALCAKIICIICRLFVHLSSPSCRGGCVEHTQNELTHIGTLHSTYLGTLYALLISRCAPHVNTHVDTPRGHVVHGVHVHQRYGIITCARSSDQIQNVPCRVLYSTTMYATYVCKSNCVFHKVFVARDGMQLRC